MKKIIYMLTLFAIANNTFCSDKKHASAGNLSINKKEHHKNTSYSENLLMVGNKQKDTQKFFSPSYISKNTERSQAQVNRRIEKDKKELIEERAKDFKENHPLNCGNHFFIKNAHGKDLEMIEHCCYCLKIWKKITNPKQTTFR